MGGKNATAVTSGTYNIDEGGEIETSWEGSSAPAKWGNTPWWTCRKGYFVAVPRSPGHPRKELLTIRRDRKAPVSHMAGVSFKNHLPLAAVITKFFCLLENWHNTFMPIIYVNTT